jgi:hypothetical protein
VTYGPPLTAERFTRYPVAPIEAGHDNATWFWAGVAVMLAGGFIATTRVVDAMWFRVVPVPLILSDSAKGSAAPVVFIVSVEVPPPPVIVAGLNPPLLTPIGKPPSLVTVRLTDPVKPLIGVTVTLNVAD